MPTNSDAEPEDDEWSDEEGDLSTDEEFPPLGESHRAASRRAIEIAKEERELRMALDDFSEHR